MKEIKLSQGAFVLVDDEDFEWLNQWKWYVGSSGYAVRKFTINGVEECVLLHRQIMNCSKGDGKIIDHKDRNKLNCQRENLRFSTHQDNARNVKSSKNSSSNYLGVSWHSARGRWRATIFKDYKQIFAGYFDTQIEAALAYNAKAKIIHGEFANLNDI